MNKLLRFISHKVLDTSSEDCVKALASNNQVKFAIASFIKPEELYSKKVLEDALKRLDANPELSDKRGEPCSAAFYRRLAEIVFTLCIGYWVGILIPFMSRYGSLLTKTESEATFVDQQFSYATVADYAAQLPQSLLFEWLTYTFDVETVFGRDALEDWRSDNDYFSKSEAADRIKSGTDSITEWVHGDDLDEYVEEQASHQDFVKTSDLDSFFKKEDIESYISTRILTDWAESNGFERAE